MTCTFLHVCFISVKMSKIYYSKLIICLGLLLLGTNRKQYCQEETIENVVHRLKGVSQKIKRCLIKEKRSNELSKGKRVKCRLFTLHRDWVCNVTLGWNQGKPSTQLRICQTLWNRLWIPERHKVLNCNPTESAFQVPACLAVRSKRGEIQVRRHSTSPANMDTRKGIPSLGSLGKEGLVIFIFQLAMFLFIFCF